MFCAVECVTNGHSKSFKVADFGTNRKGVCDFLLPINSNLGPILHRFSETPISANISYPTLIYRPRSGENPSEFLDELFITETRVLGLSITVKNGTWTILVALHSA